MTNSERMELLDMLVESVESFLYKKGIEIENEEKEQDKSASNIYGTDYGMLASLFAKVLENWKLIPTEEECMANEVRSACNSNNRQRSNCGS